NRSMSLLSLALVLVVAPSALRAQISAPLAGSSRPVYDRFTVGGAFGGLSGAANLNQAGTADWRLGWAASLNATGWVNDYVGVRAEGRDFVYKVDRYGFDKTQHDIAWQGGLTLSF